MNLFKKYNLEQISDLKTVLSNDMAEAVELWGLMAQGKAPWNKDAEPSGVINTIVGALADPVAEEMDVSAENNEALDRVIKKLHEVAKEHVQNIVTVGGEVLRPIYTNGKMQFELIKLGNYIPTSYDLDGTLTGCILVKKIEEKDTDFLLLEVHSYTTGADENGQQTHSHKVQLKLYKIKGEGITEVPLTACSMTETLTPEYSWDNVDRPFIVEIRNRVPNKIDGSAVPCAIYQGVENLVKNVDEQYARINWEQEGGELKVFADEDLFKKIQRKTGEEKDTLTGKLNRLIVKLQGNGTSDEKITEYAPTLRTPQQVEALNQNLRRLELACNIGKGTISDLEAVAQTATQYTGGKKTLYSMVDSIESELEEKYRHAAYIFAYMLSVYEGAPFDDQITITYNDAGRKDPQAQKQAALLEVQNNLLNPWEYRVLFFGEDEATAKANTPEPPASDSVGGFPIE